jgi:hypothetical protein
VTGIEILSMAGPQGPYYELKLNLLAFYQTSRRRKRLIM